MTCTFSPHLRTRLIVGFGNTVYVYDITRPSNPMKTICFGDATLGDIVAVACSPFSKTLVATACSGGTIGLIDFDKEKG
jgi:protein NEDD1